MVYNGLDEHAKKEEAKLSTLNYGCEGVEAVCLTDPI